MAHQLWSKKRVELVGGCGLVALSPLLGMWGCCTNDTTVSGPVATRTATALIDAPTLKGWATDVSELTELVVYNLGTTVTISGKPALLTINFT